MRKLLILVVVAGIGYLPFAPMSSSHQLQSQNKAVASVQIISNPPKGAVQIVPSPERKLYSPIGNATSESVTTAVEFYQSKGITNVGVAYLVGNFVSESSLRPDAIGDGGLALGIAQWHPERRVGLPDTLQGQLEFAWREIQNYPLAGALHGTNEWVLQNGIKRYEGYSVEGNRFVYARELLKELQ